jgi:hypothetical protein
MSRRAAVVSLSVALAALLGSISSAFAQQGSLEDHVRALS